MSMLRHVVGWISWFVVATQLYEFVCWNVSDSSYFLLPDGFYTWLDDMLNPTSCDASFDLAVWVTSTCVVLGLHIVIGVVLAGLVHTNRSCSAVWQCWHKGVFAVLGWASWLLVLTVTILIIVDYLLRARGSALPHTLGAVLIEVTVGLCIVGSLHLAALKIARRRPF